MDESIPFAYCGGADQDLMCRGPSYTVQNEDVLEFAILQAAQSDHPYGIIFEPPGNEILLTKNLPPIPSLAYIDGRLPTGAPVTLRGDGAKVGLTVQGKGVVLHNLKLVGFQDAAIVIKEGSQDVHLYRLRIGAPDIPNGHGIVVEPGARDVYIGRGREIGVRHCVSWEEEDMAVSCEMRDYDTYDVNVIVANMGDGIQATGVSNLLIEGTWVGFDTVNDCNMGGGARPDLANQGAGIRLENVTGAYLGPRHLFPNERQGITNLGCVAVGRSGQGGVLIKGGGDIVMRCTLLGDTPLMVPYYQNQQFGLSIEGNTAPVSYGAPADSTGMGATSANLIHVETTPAIRVANNQAPVWIRGAQLQSFGTQADTDSPYLVEISKANARVDLVHLSFMGYFRDAIIFTSMNEGIKFTLVNSYFRSSNDGSSTFVIHSASKPDDIELDHLLKVRLGRWCTGNCPSLSATDNTLFSENSEGEGWQKLSDGVTNGPIPDKPGCQVVDRGKPIGLDVNGLIDGLHSGCCPDLGAWECTSEACRAVETNCSRQCL